MLNQEQQKLVESHMDRVGYVAAKEARSIYSSRGRWEIVDELRSIIWEAICRAAETYNPSCGTTFWTYAFKSIHWSMVDYRFRGRRQVRAISYDDASGERSADDLADDREIVDRLSVRDELANALSCLSPMQRIMVLLRDGYSVPFRVMAKRLGVSNQRVNEIHKSAVALIRNRYPDCQFKRKTVTIDKSGGKFDPVVSGLLAELLKEHRRNERKNGDRGKHTKKHSY